MMSDEAPVDTLSIEPYAWREVHTAPGPGCVSPLRSLAPDFSFWRLLSMRLCSVTHSPLCS